MEGINIVMVFAISFYITTLKWIPLTTSTPLRLKFKPVKKEEVLEATVTVLSHTSPPLMPPPIWNVEALGATLTALLPKLLTTTSILIVVGSLPHPLRCSQSS